jgi:ABC-2 type transport system permease protein
MSVFHGTPTLIGLILRRDRLWLSLWIGFVTLYPLAMAMSTAKLYPTAEIRGRFVTEATANPVQIALRGQIGGTDVGHLTAWSVTSGGTLILGIVGLLLVVRHTRVEETSGRRELLGGMALGRYAALAAILIVLLCANLLVAGLITLSLGTVGLPIAGSLTLGLLLASNGWLAVALGALVAQLTEDSGAARRLGIGAVLLFFLLRALADVTRAGWIVWLSPFGWSARAAPYSSNGLWILLAVAAFSSAPIVAAFSLAGRRDVAAGVFPSRPGRATAPSSLRSPFSLAWRVHRGTILTWSGGLIILGTLLGAAIATAGGELPPVLRDLLSKQGHTHSGISTAAIFLNLLLVEISYVVAAITIAICLRLRSEETNGTADIILTAPVSRIAFVSSHLAFAIVGPVVMLLALGVSAGLSFGIFTTGVAEQLPKVVWAALVMAPSAWVMASVTMFLIGLLPKQAVAAWAIWTAFVLMGLFAGVHPIIASLARIVPFAQAPWVMANENNYWPILFATAVASGLASAGAVGFRNRDVVR